MKKITRKSDHIAQFFNWLEEIGEVKRQKDGKYAITKKGWKAIKQYE